MYRSATQLKVNSISFFTHLLNVLPDLLWFSAVPIFGNVIHNVYNSMDLVLFGISPVLYAWHVHHHLFREARMTRSPPAPMRLRILSLLTLQPLPHSGKPHQRFIPVFWTIYNSIYQSVNVFSLDVMSTNVERNVVWHITNAPGTQTWAMIVYWIW